MQGDPADPRNHLLGSLPLVLLILLLVFFGLSGVDAGIAALLQHIGL